MLDSYFDGEPSEISSGLRTPKDQIYIIHQKAKRHGVEKEFPEFLANMDKPPDFTVHLSDINRDLYWFQRTWSRLLSIGDIVNPPIPAEVIFDYYRPGNPRNKKGEIIQISPHQRGTAFDIKGGTRLLEKAKRVMKAFQNGDAFLNSYLVEHVNNCVHCDAMQIGGGTG